MFKSNVPEQIGLVKSSAPALAVPPGQATTQPDEQPVLTNVTVVNGKVEVTVMNTSPYGPMQVYGPITFPATPTFVPTIFMTPPPSIEMVAKSLVFTDVKPKVIVVVGAGATAVIVPAHELPVQGVVVPGPQIEHAGSCVVLYPEEDGPVAVKVGHVNCEKL